MKNVELSCKVTGIPSVHKPSCILLSACLADFSVRHPFVVILHCRNRPTAGLATPKYWTQWASTRPNASGNATCVSSNGVISARIRSRASSTLSIFGSLSNNTEVQCMPTLYTILWLSHAMQQNINSLFDEACHIYNKKREV